MEEEAINDNNQDIIKVVINNNNKGFNHNNHMEDFQHNKVEWVVASSNNMIQCFRKLNRQQRVPGISLILMEMANWTNMNSLLASFLPVIMVDMLFHNLMFHKRCSISTQKVCLK